MFKGYKKSLKLNNWIRTTCKPSHEGLLITDIDFVVSDFIKNKIMIIEAKTYSQGISFWQKKIYTTIHNSLKSVEGYQGAYLLVLSGEDPETSDKIFLNHIKITKNQLIKFLNFEISFEKIKESHE